MSFVVVEHAGRRYRIALLRTPRGTWVGWPGGAAFVEKKDDFAHQEGGDDAIVAPMTGKVVAVPVSVDQQVAEGAVLVILEAMKMEYRLAAPHAGRVSAVHCQAGQLVDLGAVLVSLERPAE